MQLKHMPLTGATQHRAAAATPPYCQALPHHCSAMTNLITRRSTHAALHECWMRNCPCHHHHPSSALGYQVLMTLCLLSPLLRSSQIPSSAKDLSSASAGFRT